MDYVLFKQAIDIVQMKEHLTIEGLQKIIAIKASINWGLSDVLKTAFPDVVPVVRPLVENSFPKILDPNWLAGFTSAEGCFFLINIYKSQTKLGEAVKLVFNLTQHIRDEKLMKSFIKYLNCGYVIKNITCLGLIVIKFADITEKIIPFFKKYPIHGVKAKDLADWSLVAEMIKQKNILLLKA